MKKYPKPQKFIPRNPHKYIGDVNRIIARSGLEISYMRFFDSSNNIVAWNSEEIVVNYLNPFDNKLHRYFVDFWAQTKNGDKFLIEIKPHSQCLSEERKMEISKKRSRKGSDNGMFQSARFGELNPMYGKIQSDETKQKISLANKGKPSKRKGKRLTEEQKKNMEGVNSKSWVFLYNGEKVEFVNLKKYSKEHGLNETCMSRVYRGISVIHKGYTKYE